MSLKDPHQGGDLNDMAENGTTMPNDAGVMNLIPSKPRPGEGLEGPNASGNDTNLAGAAGNASDIPRTVRDQGVTGEVETGTGDRLPASVETKRLHQSANNPLAKGHDRYDKHTRQKESDIERYASEGGGVDLQPSEDKLANSEDLPDEEVEKIVESRERKENY